MTVRTPWIVPAYIDRVVSSSFGVNDWRTISIKKSEEGQITIRVRLKITREIYVFIFSSRKTLLKMEKVPMRTIYVENLRGQFPLELPELPEKIAGGSEIPKTPRSALIAVSREGPENAEKFSDRFGYSGSNKIK